jgi:hypothetical protein
VKRSSIIFEINDEVGKTMLIFECTECRDTQISYIAARSLVEPLEANDKNVVSQKSNVVAFYRAQTTGPSITW